MLIIFCLLADTVIEGMIFAKQYKKAIILQNQTYKYG